MLATHLFNYESYQLLIDFGEYLLDIIIVCYLNGAF